MKCEQTPTPKIGIRCSSCPLVSQPQIAESVSAPEESVEDMPLPLLQLLLLPQSADAAVAQLLPAQLQDPENAAEALWGLNWSDSTTVHPSAVLQVCERLAAVGSETKRNRLVVEEGVLRVRKRYAATTYWIAALATLSGLDKAAGSLEMELSGLRKLLVVDSWGDWRRVHLPALLKLHDKLFLLKEGPKLVRRSHWLLVVSLRHATPLGRVERCLRLPGDDPSGDDPSIVVLVVEMTIWRRYNSSSCSSVCREVTDLQRCSRQSGVGTK